MLMLIVIHGAVYWSAYAGESYIALGVVYGIVVVILIRYKLGISKFYMHYLIATIFIFLLSAISNGTGLSRGLNIKTVFIINLNLLIVFVAYNIGRRTAIKYYINIVIFFAVISLVLYLTQNLFGRDIISRMFTYIQWGRGHYVNPLYTYATTDFRNYGIFYEPGVYQILLIASLYFLILTNNCCGYTEFKRMIYILILVATILTTGSTTGYINLGFILIGILLGKRRNKAESRIASVLAATVIVVIIEYFVNGDSSLIQTFLLDKLFAMKGSGRTLYFSSSGGARLFMIDMAIQALKENPLFGIGASRVNFAIFETFGEGFGTGNGLFSMIATKGLIPTTVIIGPILYLSYKNKISWQAYLIFILIYFNTVISQSTYSIGSPSFILMAMYKTNKIYSKNINVKRQYIKWSVRANKRKSMVWHFQEGNKKNRKSQI